MRDAGLPAGGDDRPDLIGGHRQPQGHLADVLAHLFEGLRRLEIDDISDNRQRFSVVVAGLALHAGDDGTAAGVRGAGIGMVVAAHFG